MRNILISSALCAIILFLNVTTVQTWALIIQNQTPQTEMNTSAVNYHGELDINGTHIVYSIDIWTTGENETHIFKAYNGTIIIENSSGTYIFAPYGNYTVLKENAIELTTAQVHLSARLSEYLWDSVYFIKKGEHDYGNPLVIYVKYDHPNNCERYYPWRWHKDYVLPDNKYPPNSDDIPGTPKWRHMHESVETMNSLLEMSETGSIVSKIIDLLEKTGLITLSPFAAWIVFAIAVSSQISARFVKHYWIAENGDGWSWLKVEIHYWYAWPFRWVFVHIVFTVGSLRPHPWVNVYTCFAY